jgi:hypothetical protein
MAASVENIVNQALLDIGYRGPRIADIREGSEAAGAALEIYGETRDEIFLAQDWPFARAAGVALALLKGPPPPGGYNPVQPWSTIYPPGNWLYEYVYPADCIELYAITKPPGAMPDLDPRPQLWRIDNDAVPIVAGNAASGPPQKVILANVPGALAVYRRKITDPSLWEPGFIALLVDALGKKLATALGMAPQVEQARTQDLAPLSAIAGRHNG